MLILISEKKIKWIFLLVFLFLVVKVSSVKAVTQEEKEKIREEIIQLVNQEREKLGLNLLRESEKLNQAAFLKAQDMIGNNYFAHTSPSGIDPWYWFDQVNYQYRYAGENLGMNFFSASSVHHAWMRSKTHQENIISPNYTEIGVAVLEGIIEGEKQTLVAVQEFGKPLVEEKKKEAFPKDQENDLFIKEAFIKKWKGIYEEEALVYAFIEGQPEKVDVFVEGKSYPLEKLRENIYMNLVILDKQLSNDKFIIKASLNEKEAQFFETDVVAEEDKLILVKEKEKEKEKEEENFFLGKIDQNNQNKTSSQILWFNFKNNFLKVLNDQILLVGVLIIFLILVGNVWILEKEEERLILAVEKKIIN